MVETKDSGQFLAIVRELADLIVRGAEHAEKLISTGKIPSFDDWAKLFRNDPRCTNGSCELEHLTWIWDALRTHPNLFQRYGALPGRGVDALSPGSVIKALDAGARFYIGLSRDHAGSLKSPDSVMLYGDEIVVETQEPLFMRHGKGGRLECCDCQARVTIPLDHVESLDRESDIMRVEKGRIAIEGTRVIVRVDSLNQAYTVASRRLQPTRRAHGGRTYDHLVYVSGERRMLLEELRTQVERRLQGDGESENILPSRDFQNQRTLFVDATSPVGTNK